MTASATVFALAAIGLVVAGSVLARAAQGIAEATRLGGLWVGSLLVAAATSLPEVSTDVAAIRVGAPDLAAGDLFGSCMANMLILALVDLASGGDRRQTGVQAHVLSASLAISLVTLAGLSLLFQGGPTLLGVGFDTLAIAAVFLAGSAAIYRVASESRAAAPESEHAPVSLRAAGARFAISAVAILAIAPPFARSARDLAELTGLGTTFFGTLLLGLSTSLPELVASLAAVRLRALDIAIGNLFGSNAFNMVVFLALDVADGPGRIFASLDRMHAATVLASILLMAIGLSTVVHRPARLRAWVEPSGTLMILVYLLAVGGLYLATAQAPHAS
jgi:cation:H+ antiporter